MFTRVIIRTSKNSSMLSPLLRLNNFSSTVSPEPKNVGTEIEENRQSGNEFFRRNRIVEAAFASLQTNKQDIKTPLTDNKLEQATTVDELLCVTEGNGVSRRHALRVRKY